MKYLISACLLGENCRYDGNNNLVPAMKTLFDRGEAIPFCPEVEGGLPTPRIPCEIVVRSGKQYVIDKEGTDCTEAFVLGAQKALEYCQKHGIKKAILKANSPSCGNRHVYDGTFSKQLRKGAGICAQLLMNNGIDVENEKNMEI